ncbi:hypothetical protein ACVBE9_04240 [Eionea flava]
MDSLFMGVAFTSMNADVELTWTYSQRATAINNESMSGTELSAKLKRWKSDKY